MATQTHSTAAEELAAVAEQFRKTAAAATEQARQTITAAQEQFQQNIDQAKQQQSDLVQVLARLSEQNGQLVGAAFAGFWDTSLTMLKMATWGQDQAERTLQQLMEQGRLSREEGTQLLREAAEQVRGHQAELHRLAQQSLRAGLAAMSPGGADAPTWGKSQTGRAKH